MIAVPESLPDDPILLKHLLLLASEQAAAKDARIEQLQEQVALLRHKLFSPKSERSPEDADSPQLAMFNEAEELIEGIRSMNHTYRKTTASFTVASLASSSMAVALRNRPPTPHAAAAPGRGAATYRAPGR